MHDKVDEMELTEDNCYRALLAHDRRFDGVFFTCVKTTGIYCRPVCTAVVPRRESCMFVATAALAERQGFRPCLRCRPEYAPLIHSSVDSPPKALAAYIDETLLLDETLADVMKRYVVGERQLRRLFIQAYGIEPKRYVTSRRLLFAKQLLQDTIMPITDIAYAVGFSSRGRLTINMQEIYGFTPERLRKGSANVKSKKSVTLRADYRTPFNWTELLAFLQGRATPLEWVTENAVYHRVVEGYEITVENIADKAYLHVHIPVELSLKAHMIMTKVRRLFDLDANPEVIASDLAEDALLSPLVTAYPGLRVPGCWDNFEMLLRVIVGQQVSVAGATTIMRRLVDRIGITPEAIAASSPDEIAAVGMPGRRALTIWTVADLIISGAINLEERNASLFYEQLVSVAGIGPWTAEYLRMRILHWPDAFPSGDLGLQKAVERGRRVTERELLRRSEVWRPWRSYATVLLWKSLENKGG